jgi:transposase
MAEKRRIVELVLEPGVSVARVAQAEGVNANQVFKWRREYRDGRLVEAGESATSLLPVVVSATSFEAGVALSAPVCPEPAAPTGAIHIDFPGCESIAAAVKETVERARALAATPSSAVAVAPLSTSPPAMA